MSSRPAVPVLCAATLAGLLCQASPGAAAEAVAAADSAAQSVPAPSPVPAPKREAPWELRAALGGELHSTSFGIGDVGVRKGAFSLQLFTDTLDIRYAPELARGRWFVGARVETFAAGLLISPWTAGAPDPGRALNAGYAGLDGGWMRYLPRSIYAGLAGSARVYFFWGQDQTRIEVPSPLPVFSLDAVVGRYTETSHVWLRAGVDLEIGRTAPHVALEARLRPAGSWAPLVEFRAAWARNQDFILRTRLGGMNPYVVPLAGAAWAEWWVESYAALRVGPSLRTSLRNRPEHQLEAALVTDVALFEGGSPVGFSLLGKYRYRRYSVEAAFGYAPWILRQEGLVRVAGFVLLGLDWGPLRRPRVPAAT